MAKRASETFHVWTAQGSGDKKYTVKQTFQKDGIVPAAVAKANPDSVYDDGAK